MQTAVALAHRLMPSPTVADVDACYYAMKAAMEKQREADAKAVGFEAYAALVRNLPIIDGEPDEDSTLQTCNESNRPTGSEAHPAIGAAGALPSGSSEAVLLDEARPSPDQHRGTISDCAKCLGTGYIGSFGKDPCPECSGFGHVSSLPPPVPQPAESLRAGVEPGPPNEMANPARWRHMASETWDHICSGPAETFTEHAIVSIADTLAQVAGAIAAHSRNVACPSDPDSLPPRTAAALAWQQEHPEADAVVNVGFAAQLERELVIRTNERDRAEDAVDAMYSRACGVAPHSDERHCADCGKTVTRKLNGVVVLSESSQYPESEAKP